MAISSSHDGNTIHILSQTGRNDGIWSLTEYPLTVRSCVTGKFTPRRDPKAYSNLRDDNLTDHNSSSSKYLSRLHNFSLKETKNKNWQDRHDFLKIRAQCGASLSLCSSFTVLSSVSSSTKKEDFECPGSNNLCLCVTSFFFLFQVFCSQDINHPPIYDLGHPQVTHACIHAKLLQLYPTLCDSVDCSPPGSSVHGVLQERIPEWVAVPSSKGSSRPGIEPKSLVSPALAGGFFTTSATWEAPTSHSVSYFLSFSEASWQSPWCSDTVSVSTPCLGVRQRIL